MGIMTCYNVNNGVPAADDWGLCTDLARGEWKFDGLVMSDCGGGQSPPSISMHAGNDLIMPGSQKDVEEILSSVGVDEGDKEYPLTRKELEECAVRILRVIAQSSAYENSVPYRAAAKEEMI